MELTDQQLADIKDNYLGEAKTIREWMNDNELGVADIKPREILTQLKAKYDDETVNGLMKNLRDANLGRQFTMMSSRMCSRPGITVEQCDQLLAKLQDATVTIQAKKAELQAG